MSLSAQVKVPAQVKGAVGGGGSGALSAAEMPTGIDAAKIGDGSVSTTEFQYINTLSSNAQTQISTKQAAITGTPTGTKFARDTGAWSAIADGDLPSTSNNATISAISTVANAALPKAGGSSNPITGDLYFSQTDALILPNTSDGSDSKSITVGGGGGNASNRGGRLQVFGEQYPTYGGIAALLAGVGGSAGLYDSSGFSRVVATAAGAVSLNAITTINQSFIQTGAHTALASTVNGIYCDANAMYYQTGANLVKAAKLVSRANSTAYSICAAPAGDVLRVLIQDSSSKRAIALVDSSGSVTFESGSHADYVASSSPASGEVGVYILSSVLTIKPGSAGARSIAVSVERARS